MPKALRGLRRKIERRKKERNDIEQDALIAIRNKNLETEKFQLIIDRDTQQAELSLQEGIERWRIAQRLSIEVQKFGRETELQRLEAHAHAAA